MKLMRSSAVQIIILLKQTYCPANTGVIAKTIGIKE